MINITLKGGEIMKRTAEKLFKIYVVAAVAGAASFIALAWVATKAALALVEE